MGNDFNHLVKKYTIKEEGTLKRICTPLHNLNIFTFGYAVIKADGTFCNISNFAPPLEYYYAEKMHNTHPYFRHPNLFQTGYTLSQFTVNLLFKKKIENRYNINHSLCKIQKHRDCMEIFFFHPSINQPRNCLKYLNKIYLLDKFTTYFKQEAKTIIRSAMDEGYNLLKTQDHTFYEAYPNFNLLSNDQKTQQFLKKISPLTVREHQCLDLFKQGRSAQATAAILNLSQRTVEHYFDNIKAKLGCQSKSELLEW